MRKLFVEYSQSLLALLAGMSILNIFLKIMFMADGSSLKSIVDSWLSGLI